MQSRERILSVPPSECSSGEEEEEYHENNSLDMDEDEVANLALFSPELPILNFASDDSSVAAYQDPLPSPLEFSSFPSSSTALPLFTPRSIGKLSKLFKSTPRKGLCGVPLPSFIRHCELQAYTFDDTGNKAGDPAEDGFPDSPEQTYEERVMRESYARNMDTAEPEEEEWITKWRAERRASVTSSGMDTDTTMDPAYDEDPSTIQRPAASFGFRDGEDHENSSPKNMSSLADELSIPDHQTFPTSSTRSISAEIDEDADDDSDEDRQFFQREGSNPPEEWV